jgi:hypothetical protein
VIAMTETKAIFLVIIVALLIEVGGTLGLMAFGAGDTALTFPGLIAVAFAGLSIGGVVSRFGGKADRQA